MNSEQPGKSFDDNKTVIVSQEKPVWVYCDLLKEQPLPSGTCSVCVCVYVWVWICGCQIECINIYITENDKEWAEFHEALGTRKWNHELPVKKGNNKRTKGSNLGSESVKPAASTAGSEGSAAESKV